MLSLKARLSNVYMRFIDNSWHVDLEIEDWNPEDINLIQDKALKVILKQWRKPKSTDANALFWSCVSDIAREKGTKKDEEYLRVLKDYGLFTYICVIPKAVAAVKKQWREVEEVGIIEVGQNKSKAIQMRCYYGISTYDSGEFSKLIDNVIREMEELGIPRPLPKDVEALIEDMKDKEHGKKT